MIKETHPAETHRPPSAAEIRQLERQGCTAEDWQQLAIAPDTDLRQLEFVHFSGTNRIGAFRATVSFPGGPARHTGIRHATLHNVCVGDDCLIEHIHGYIAHYDIAPGCVILHTDTLAMNGRSAFGEGVELSVMCESGGREILMHDRLSAQEAYLQAMHRHAPRFIHRLRKMIADHAESQSSERGSIGTHAWLLHCGRLWNVRIGPYARLEGVTRLENGTVCSHPEAPSFVGDGVIARDFIFQTGSRVAEGTMLTRCHVGQASAIGHGFTASDTYFACNCQAENGEACAVFAGPYTVTHHKSTLLIGGMFSFMNAGSGTNQSNHAYKLGPRHYGILERGCKTASGSHISWPVRIGAFSLVMGHCAPHVDSHPFPFSYVVEQDGTNYVIPGIALRGVGTLRDMRKWPERDGRAADAPRTDHIVFEAYSPYTMERVWQAHALLTDFESRCSDGEQETAWDGLRIKRRHVVAGKELYALAIDRFLGDWLLNRLEDLGDPLPEDLYAALRPSAPCDGHWCDIGGLLAPKAEIDRLERDVADGHLAQLEGLHERLRTLHESYKAQAWAWTWQRLLEHYPGTAAGNFIEAVCLPAIRKWETAATELNRQIIADACKEFAIPSLCVFGIDGGDAEGVADKLAVLGTPDEHPLIRELKEQQCQIREKAGLWLRKLGETSGQVEPHP